MNIKLVKKNRLLFLSVILNIIMLFVFFWYAITHREEIVQKIVNIRDSATVIMFGDSHTANGKWSVLLSRFDVLRVGYGGFTSDQLKGILIKKVLNHEAKICFIQCGGNDINSKCFSRIDIKKNFVEIIDSLKSHNITPVVQSLFYRYNNSEYNMVVDSLNNLLYHLAAIKNVNYLDINKNISDNKELRKELTTDNIHLNKEGYRIWSDEVKKYLSNKGI